MCSLDISVGRSLCRGSLKTLSKECVSNLRHLILDTIMILQISLSQKLVITSDDVFEVEHSD